MISINNPKSKKIFQDIVDQYYTSKMLSLSQRELITIEAMNQKLSIPHEIIASNISHHLLPIQNIINFINHLANNSNPKFKPRLHQASIHYKNFGWLSIIQRELVYVSAYKQNKSIPIEFKKLTSDKDEKNYIDTPNNITTH